MRSLFVKIFLWFWVAMLLVSFASFLSAVATESHPFLPMPWLRFLVRSRSTGHVRMHSGSFTGHWISVAGNSLRLSGETAVAIYERDGKAAFLNYLNKLQKVLGINFFLFDEKNEQLTQWAIPKDVRRLVLKATKNWLDFKRSRDWIYTAQRLTGPSGKEYTLVARFSARHFELRDYSFLAMNLSILFITAGGVCYWLARYISRPIGKLGSAARRLADGDLTVRVGGLLGRRHDEITELGRDFDQMAERIESLINSQKRLLRDISHEFRSPLARLCLALEIARRHDGRDAGKALERIELETERLNALIGKLLMLGRLESGAKEMDREAVNMVELLEELVADADFEARGRNCRVRIVSAEKCFVRGSRELLRSAVENVLRNAVRHTAEETEVTVVLRCGAYPVQAGLARPETPMPAACTRGTTAGRTEDGAARRRSQVASLGGALRAVIEVRDNGPGVPEASLSHIFYPFYRVGDARDRKQGGTGLGLAITERAVKMHGGQIWAANDPGGGLKVTIHLPAGHAETAQRA